MVLTNLIPGLRELRAPLAAGFLWIVVAWVAGVGEWPGEDSSSELAQRLRDSRDFVGTTAAAAALAFLAYLVGSITADVTTALLRRSPVGDEPFSSVHELVDRTVDLANRHGPMDRLVGAAAEALPANDRQRFLGEVDRVNTIEGAPEVAEARQLVSEAVDAGAPTPRSVVIDLLFPSSSEDHPGREGFEELGTKFRELVYGAGSRLGEDAYEVVRVTEDGANARLLVIVGNYLRERVLNELDLVMTRLLGEEDEIYGLVDRLRTEAELRVALIPPIIGLAVVGGIRDSSVFWLLLLLVAPILYRQAKRRNQRANSNILDALAIERVVAPTLERFLRAAGVDPEIAKSQTRAPS